MTASTRKHGEREQLLYSRKQVARMLGNVSTATVRRLETQGRLHGIRLTKSKGNVFFRSGDIEAFLNEVPNAKA